jgi:hypothetical protein
MRPLLALTFLLLGFNVAAPEPEYSSLIGDYFHPTDENSLPSLVEIEFSTRKADRLTVAALPVLEPPDELPDLAAVEPPPTPAPSSTDTDAGPTPEVSLDHLCNALFTAAQDNDLPVPFFANLIWQESRLRDDAVSRVGALGIAQFMPQVAMASGLEDPFDPLQAIPASARLLRELRQQFGNLGFVAAAYNAGAHRVGEWLEHRRALPRETRDYVVRVTGRSAEDWRKTPRGDAALAFVRHLPCRGLPAFAELEQAQLEQAQWREAQLQATKSQRTQQTAATMHGGHRHSGDHKRLGKHNRHEAIRTAARDLRGGKRQAERVQRASHGKHNNPYGKTSIEAKIGLRKIASHRAAAKRA